MKISQTLRMLLPDKGQPKQLKSRRIIERRRKLPNRRGQLRSISNTRHNIVNNLITGVRKRVYRFTRRHVDGRWRTAFADHARLQSRKQRLVGYASSREI